MRNAIFCFFVVNYVFFALVSNFSFFCKQKKFCFGAGSFRMKTYFQRIDNGMRLCEVYVVYSFRVPDSQECYGNEFAHSENSIVSGEGRILYECT